MKLRWVLLSVLSLQSSQFTLSAHPSSGIVVTDKGEVFFVHSGKGVAKIEPDGKLTYVKQSTGGHWLCLDREGKFARTQPKFFERITPDGEKPAIIFADGGAPIAVCRDGNLYYGSGHSGGHDHDPGGATVTRLSTNGTMTHFTPKLPERFRKVNGGVTGLAAGPDGALYVVSPSDIFKVQMDGTVTPVAEDVVVKECDETLRADMRPPQLWGAAVATNGVVYAAAAGCRCLVTITPRGAVKTILKSESPWSPTGVALHGENVFVLEWTNANGRPEDGWRPRVRKLAPDGKVTTLVEVKENFVIPRR